MLRRCSECSVRKFNSGFSLIELMVVISIMALLTTIGVATLRDSKTKAERGKAKANVDAIVKLYEGTYIPNAGKYRPLTSRDFQSGLAPEAAKFEGLLTAETRSYKVCAKVDVNFTGSCLDTPDPAKCYCRTNSQGILPTLTQPTPLASLETGPIGYWKFDEGYGATTQDQSGSNLGGTLINSPAWQTENLCLNGKCLSFNGSNNRVEVAHSININFERTNSFSISAWVYPTAFTGNYIVSKMDGTNVDHKGWYFIGPRSDGTYEVLIRSTESLGITKGVRTTNTFTTLNQWYHVAFTYDGSGTAFGMKIYINGVLQNTTELGGTLSGTIQHTQPLRIGGWKHDSYGGGTPTFSGRIDNVKIYNYTRTDSQIQAEFQARGR